MCFCVFVDILLIKFKWGLCIVVIDRFVIIGIILFILLSMNLDDIVVVIKCFCFFWIMIMGSCLVCCFNDMMLFFKRVDRKGSNSRYMLLFVLYWLNSIIFCSNVDLFEGVI